MKIYKDFEITFHDEKGAFDFLNKIIASSDSSHFLYSKEYSQNGQPGIIQVFAKGLDNLPDSRIIIRQAYNKVSIINIVPLPPVNHLDQDQYNTIVDIYDQDVLSPLYLPMEAIAKKSKGFIDIREKLPLSFRYLEMWAKLANTNNPFVHPLDEERWYKFICENVRTGESTSSDLIQNYVSEELHWYEDLPMDVAIRYEQDRDLIKYYMTNYR